MKTIRKSYFSLIEVLVSTGLAIGILAVLMGFYSYVVHIGKLGENLEKRTFNTLYLQFRLTELLPRTIPFYELIKDRNKLLVKSGTKREDLKKESDYNFFTSSINEMPSLTFLFSAESSTDPDFGGNSLGRFFVDTKKQLCFALLPAPSRWTLSGEPPVKLEILATDVEAIRFSFFVPLEADREEMWKDLKVPAEKEDSPHPILELPQGQWVSEWRNDYAKLPPLVRLELDRNKKTETFIIPLVKSEYMIVYE